MQIGILNYDYAVPTSVTGPADIFAALMRTYPLVRGKELDAVFCIDFITEKKGAFWRKPFNEKEQQKITADYAYDLVIVPAMFSNKIEEVIKKETRIIQWLKQQYDKDTELASICVGSFLLAATGLLDGKKATTNWMFADLFREKYPPCSDAS